MLQVLKEPNMISPTSRIVRNMFILSLQNQWKYQFFIDSVTWNWICSRQFSTLSRPYFSPSEATVNITNWKLSPEMCLNTSKMHLKKLNIFKIHENHDFAYFCRFSVILKPRVNIFPAILDFGDTVFDSFKSSYKRF